MRNGRLGHKGEMLSPLFYIDLVIIIIFDLKFPFFSGSIFFIPQLGVELTT
jgi:hypothetical protein